MKRITKANQRKAAKLTIELGKAHGLYESWSWFLKPDNIKIKLDKRSMLDYEYEGDEVWSAK